jgi:acyl carrier protein
MYEWLRDTLVDRLKLPADAVRPDACADDAGLDSLAVTELVMIAQEELGLSVDEDELAGLGTIGEVAAYLESRRQPAAR